MTAYPTSIQEIAKAAVAGLARERERIRKAHPDWDDQRVRAEADRTPVGQLAYDAAEVSRRCCACGRPARRGTAAGPRG